MSAVFSVGIWQVVPGSITSLTGAGLEWVAHEVDDSQFEWIDPATRVPAGQAKLLARVTGHTGAIGYLSAGCGVLVSSSTGALSPASGLLPAQDNDLQSATQ